MSMEARLLTSSGMDVLGETFTITMPPFNIPPQVVLWGTRAFVLEVCAPPWAAPAVTYREVFAVSAEAYIPTPISA